MLKLYYKNFITYNINRLPTTLRNGLERNEKHKVFAKKKKRHKGEPESTKTENLKLIGWAPQQNEQNGEYRGSNKCTSRQSNRNCAAGSTHRK